MLSQKRWNSNTLTERLLQMDFQFIYYFCMSMSVSSYFLPVKPLVYGVPHSCTVCPTRVQSAPLVCGLPNCGSRINCAVFMDKSDVMI